MKYFGARINLGVYPPKNWLARCYRLYRKYSVEDTNEIIRSFLGDNLSISQLRYYRIKLNWAYVWHKWSNSEYFQFGYERLSRQGRKAYVTEIEKDIFCRKYNSLDAHLILKNKGLTYKYFAPYYYRDVCVVNDWEQDLEQLKSFLAKHRDFIVKPTCENKGSGVVIIRNGTVDDIIPLFRDTNDGLIIEEIIDQSEELAVFHPQSVNTVRILTWVVGGEVHIMPSFIRFGYGGSDVDNAAKGGPFGYIDLESGIVTGVCDMKGHPAIFHPDSHRSIVGLAIPQWEQCKALAKELSQILPEAKYVGWDLAFTNKGWVLVEGNGYGQFVCQQLSSGKGVRERFLEIDPNCFN